MRRSSSPTDKKLVRAHTLNRMEDKMLNRKITGLSRTEKQLQRELQQIQRARLSLQQGMENLNIRYTRKDSFDSNKYARQMHSKRRFSTGNLLAVPKKDNTKLAGAVRLPEIHPKEISVLNEKNNTKKIELDHVINSEAKMVDKKPHSSFPLERQSLTLGDTDGDTDDIKAEITQRCNESFAVPSFRRLRNRRRSLPTLSPICCEEFEEESSKRDNEMENEIESKIEKEGTARMIKVVSSMRSDVVGIHEGDARPVTCAVPSKESNTIRRRRSKEFADHDEVIRPGTCAVPSKESNTIRRRRSKDFADQDEAIRLGTCAVSSKESNPSQQLLSKDFIDIDEKQRLYARRGRRASAPVIMAHPQAFTQPQPPSIPLRKTNQELLNDECLKGKFRAIGHTVLGSVLLKSRRKSIAGVSENGFPKGT